jgi:hypothetical protein
MFANLDALKASVRSSLTVDSFDVKDLYKEDGVMQRVAKSQAFETLTLLVIGLNAIYIAIEVDYNDAEIVTDAQPIFQIAQNLFCSFFFIEVIVRFSAFRYKIYCFYDLWFLMDSLLAFLMVLDTWLIGLIVLISTDPTQAASELRKTSLLRVARLLRLTRMARMVKILKAFPELTILIKGMMAASRSVFCTLVLLCFLLYIFAIIFTQTLRDTTVGEEYFSGVAQSMHTLWLYGALLDEITHLMSELEPAGKGHVLILNLFIILGGVMTMNMLVGVLVEVVAAVSSSEKEEQGLIHVRNKLERILKELGIDRDKTENDGMISKEQFQMIVNDTDAVLLIQDLGVDVLQMVDAADVLFACEEDAGEFKTLTFEEFMEAVQQMRGTNFATVKDMVHLRKFLTENVAKQNKDLREYMRSMTKGPSGTRRDSSRRGTRNDTSELSRSKTKNSLDSKEVSAANNSGSEGKTSGEGSPESPRKPPLLRRHTDFTLSESAATAATAAQAFLKRKRTQSFMKR